MARKITVVLTEAEAKALWFAAGEVLGPSTGFDEAVGLMGSAATVNAGLRAMAAMKTAIYGQAYPTAKTRGEVT